MQPSIDDLLRPWIDDPAGAGVLTDFDGTLAPIVADPTTAAALPGAVEVLGRLAARYATVGVVSGRSVSYLDRRLQVPGDDVGARLVLSGLYGLERMDAGRRVLRPGVEAWSEAVHRAAAEAERWVPAGVLVERKGLTFSLHARQVPEHLDELQRYAGELAVRTGLQAVPGRMLVELRPPIDVDKGVIVTELSSGLRAVCYAGDDIGDLPAFVALGRLRTSGVTTLSIVARSDESPPSVLAAADVVVDGPQGVLELLGRLAG